MMKIAVYGICKDEIVNLSEFLQNVSNADYVCLLDTGSTDGTWEMLQRWMGVITAQKIIDPWRFDTARNEALKLIPADADVCISMDLDERLEDGWREGIEKTWKIGDNAGVYDFAYGADGSTMEGYRIHANGAVRWVHAIHEVPEWTQSKVVCRLPIRMRHKQRAKDRSQYLPMLELEAQENPCSRNLHYLGREYYYHARYEDAVRTLEASLRAQDATWDEERSESMRLIGLCKQAEGEIADAERWLFRAAAMCHKRREPLVDLASMAYDRCDWHLTAALAGAALAITEKGTYPTDGSAWGAKPWDLLSLGLWYTGRRDEALAAGKQATALSPDDKRLAENVKIMEELLWNR